MLELDDDDAIASEDVPDLSVFRPSETIYVRARQQTNCLRFGNKRRRVDAEAHEVIEAKVPRTVKHENVLLPPSESSPQNLSFSSTCSDILSDALKTH